MSGNTERPPQDVKRPDPKGDWVGVWDYAHALERYADAEHTARVEAERRNRKMEGEKRAAVKGAWKMAGEERLEDAEEYNDRISELEEELTNQHDRFEDRLIELEELLREHRGVFQRAIDTMPQDAHGALQIVVRQHRARVEAIDAAIGEKPTVGEGSS